MKEQYPRYKYVQERYQKVNIENKKPSSTYDLNKNSQTRIIQRNLVYLIGISKSSAKEEILKKQEFMGQYGQISKIVINNTAFHVQGEPQYSAYITYDTPLEASIAIVSLQEFSFEGSFLKAHFGASKYCQFFLKNQACTNSECVFQHATAQEEDILNQGEIHNQKNLISFHTELANKIISNQKEKLTNYTNLEIKSVFPSSKQIALQIQNKQIQDIQLSKPKKLNILDESYLEPQKIANEYDSLTVSSINNCDHTLDFEENTDRLIIQKFMENFDPKRNSRFNFTNTQPNTEKDISFQIKDFIQNQYNQKQIFLSQCFFQINFLKNPMSDNDFNQEQKLKITNQVHYDFEF